MGDTHVPKTGPGLRRKKGWLPMQTGGSVGAPTVRKPVKSIGRNTNTHYDERGRKRQR